MNSNHEKKVLGAKTPAKVLTKAGEIKVAPKAGPKAALAKAVGGKATAAKPVAAKAVAAKAVAAKAVPKAAVKVAAVAAAKPTTPAKVAAVQVKQVAKDAKKDQNAKKELDKALATQKTQLTTELKQQVVSAIQNAVNKFKAAQNAQA